MADKPDFIADLRLADVAKWAFTLADVRWRDGDISGLTLRLRDTIDEAITEVVERNEQIRNYHRDKAVGYDV